MVKILDGIVSAGGGSGPIDFACWQTWKHIKHEASALTMARAFRHASRMGWVGRGYGLNDPVDGTEPDGWDVARAKALYKHLVSSVPDDEAGDHADEIRACLALAPPEWRRHLAHTNLMRNLPAEENV